MSEPKLVHLKDSELQDMRGLTKDAGNHLRELGVRALRWVYGESHSYRIGSMRIVFDQDNRAKTVDIMGEKGELLAHCAADGGT